MEPRAGARASRMTSERAVDVVVDVPRLELDRSFTYALPDGVDAPTGTLVSVPFHGRTVKAWVVGPAEDIPERVLRVRRVLSAGPLFDRHALRLFRWMSQRYVAPLAAVIGRAQPPRVASEERRSVPAPAPVPPLRTRDVLPRYRGGPGLLEACRGGAGAFVVRPLPDDEADACVDAVAACVSDGRDAVVVVPEAEPMPATAKRVLEVFGDAALWFAAGDRRWRYRAWVEIRGGRYRVVVGTRPAVFAPLPRVGLVWVNREIHPGHREERAPYHRTRDVGLARAHLEAACCVLSGLVPAADSVSLVEAGEATVVHAPRDRERAHAPLVEDVRPAAEDRSSRLGSVLRNAHGAVLLASRRGYGIARVCRACGEPARCERCEGALTVAERGTRCAVCGAEGRCRRCGGTAFGVERGGTERIEEWASRVTAQPVIRVDDGQDAVAPGPGRVVVGTAAAVKDFGPVRVDLVAFLDPDRARRRPGLVAPEQALATWFEAAGWAGPRSDGGRVIVQTREPSDPAIQALVRWDAWRAQRQEVVRRTEAGFPPGFPVFRVRGTPGLPDALAELQPHALLSSAVGEEAVCLVTFRPEAVGGFRDRMVALAEAKTVSRVEAEPHL